MKRLEGRAAIVSGSINGIGAATAKRFAAEGAQVMLADIHHEAAEKVAAEIRAAGGKADAHFVDLADETSIVTLIGATIERFDRLDILFNNVADTRAETMAKDGPVEVMDVELWDSVFRVNTRGTMLMIKHALPALVKSGNASIINTSSGAALRGDLFRTAYAASKMAVHALTSSVAAQYGKQGVRCNVVSPGMVLTESAAEKQAANLEMYERHHLTPYLGKAEDLAAVVTMLASDDGRFVTGQIICVDGGVLAHMPHVADARPLMDAYLADRA